MFACLLPFEIFKFSGLSILMNVLGSVACFAFRGIAFFVGEGERGRLLKKF